MHATGKAVGAEVHAGPETVASDVRLYDGGFEEWANVPVGLRGRCPVKTKTITVVETNVRSSRQTDRTKR